MGDYRTTPGEKLPLPGLQRRSRLRKWLLGGLLFALAIAAVGFLVEIDRYVRASGYVTTEEYAEVRAPLTGTVEMILVESGQWIEQGELLVRLDRSQEEAALQEARTQLRKSEAEAARRRSEIAEEKRRLTESIEVAELQFENSISNLERARDLSTKGLIAGSRLEDLELQRKLMEANLRALKNRDLSKFEHELSVIESELEAQKKAVEVAEMQVRRRDIRAPIAGEVMRYEFSLGELVRPETVLMEIFGGHRQILKLRVAERFAALVAVEQPYIALLAPYRGTHEVEFKGEVEKLRNVIQGDGVRNYRVAYCSFNAGDLDIPPGTSGEARIYYGRSNLWKFLLGLR